MTVNHGVYFLDFRSLNPDCMNSAWYTVSYFQSVCVLSTALENCFENCRVILTTIIEVLRKQLEWRPVYPQNIVNNTTITFAGVLQAI